MNLNSYFLNKPQLAEAVKEFFNSELSIQLKDKVDQPLVASQILGKEFRFLNQIESLYFCGGISDQTFQQGEDKSWQELAEKVKYNALLIFAIQLKQDNPTRTLLSEITRKLNRVSNGAPVVVLFRYDECLSIATCERITKKKGDGEKVGKVSLLKDLDLTNPHAGHLRILMDLRISRSGKKAVNTFDQLYAQWLSVFNLKVLNEKFYQELFHWYLWALRTVEIPPKPKSEKLEEEALKSIFVIRLITRLMFVWFVKEKKLINDKLFEEEELANHIKKFDPTSIETSKYYRSILQNLFFATLNTPLRKEAKDETEVRRFIDLSKKGNKGYSDGYTDQTLYRYEDYFKDSAKALELFDKIPFLNGGLFECLDFPENKTTGEPERRYDGFSSVKEKQAFVPEALFFGGETELDITQDLEEEKKKGKTVKRLVKVRGLIHTLNDYKFTITENTPLEEEIALDPELLGKVFENLLASYNPETKATARKQTGSFYTPREIVNYMVDESLKAYLLQRLLQGPQAFVEFGRKQTQMFGNEVKKGQASLLEEVEVDESKKQKYSAQLENLFQYAEETNPFNEDETDLLIRAISDCKILDPACGSGAFPMGILHRMVNLLAKLDPNNKKWKEELLRKAEEDLSLAKKMGDEVIKEKAIESAKLRIQYIKDSFANNKHELDYTRKLFLIEHCIYGVDIQQIAVQIAKLRFFISLMVDQQLDDAKPNRNILSMPNLETKFVAGNSLISLDQNVGTKKGVVGSGLFRSRDVEQLEQTLKELRKEIFYTRRYAAKKALKTKEEKLRADLKAALKTSGYDERSAQQMADWNPFDPIHSAGFFEREIMFGFKEGFDLIIGNPPYGIKPKGKEYLAWVTQYYSEGKKCPDSYVLFMILANRLGANNSTVSYIVPNTFCDIEQGSEFRKWFLTQNSVKSVYDTGWAFDSAIVDTLVFLAKTGVNKSPTFVLRDREGVSRKIDIKSILSSPGNKIDIRSESAFKKVHDKIAKIAVPFGSVCTVKAGIILYEKGKGKPPQTERTLKDKPFNKIGSPPRSWQRLVRGEAIDRYLIHDSNEWVSYGEWLAAPREEDLFKGPRIIIRRTDDVIRSCFTEENFVCVKSCHILKCDGLNRLKYLGGVLNSKLIQKIFEYQNPQMVGKVFAEIKVAYIENLLFVEADMDNTKFIAQTVDKILKKKKDNPLVNTGDLEREIDLKVYHLYNLTLQEAQLIDATVTEEEWNKTS